MSVSKSLIRQSHFLGTKIRNLRKNNHLTMEDLSARCVRINPEYAPSVSYLSMIERGKRVPSIDMLEVIAEVFQKDRPIKDPIKLYCIIITGLWPIQ